MKGEGAMEKRKTAIIIALMLIVVVLCIANIWQHGQVVKHKTQRDNVVSLFNVYAGHVKAFITELQTIESVDDIAPLIDKYNKKDGS